jgi:agmatine deiminase
LCGQGIYEFWLPNLQKDWMKVIDAETNFIYLADALRERFPHFHSNFIRLLEEFEVPVGHIESTVNVWAVDYMPIQISKEKFVQFIYKPDYLRSSKKWLDTIPDVNAICLRVDIKTVKSKIVLDGGNVVPWNDKVILCEKVFKENRGYSKDNLIEELKELLEVNSIIFIPQQPNDFIGHADGMVRFIDGNTVIVNDYSKESKRFQHNFRKALVDAGITPVEIPYNPYNNKNNLSAVGTYTNFLEVKDLIIVPQFGIREDLTAFNRFQEIFPNRSIVPLNAEEIANDGGVLKIVNWKIIF